jgi:hypothetical protein
VNVEDVVIRVQGFPPWVDATALRLGEVADGFKGSRLQAWIRNAQPSCSAPSG